MSPKKRILQTTLKIIFAFVVASSSTATVAIAASSPWIAGHKAKVRLVSGGAAGAEAGSSLAFVEIALEPGWKTYWRTPGDAGGLPPSFDWSNSTNVANATVEFPAPRRFTDKSGSTIGYHDVVVLPVTVTPKDPGAPVSLVLGLHYGICKEICVPVEAELALKLPHDESEALPAEIEEALKLIPRPQDKLAAGDPVLMAATAKLDGAEPRISIEARFPDGAAGADAFIEAPDGAFIPLPQQVGKPDSSGRALFEVPLGEDVDLPGLKGKTLTVTLVSDTGASYATFVAE